MLDRPVLRRIVSVTVVVVGFMAITLLSPLLLAGSAVVDAARWARTRSSWMATRMLAFLWVYLLGEVWAVIALGTVALLPRRRSIAATYRLQEIWASWTLGAIRGLFSLSFTVDGSTEIPPGPILVLSRHASLIDTLLPAAYITESHGIRLRYVLKQELLVDPALDIAGNRLPNCFVARSGDRERERAAIQAVTDGLDSHEGILIYPEGTRYSDEKRVAFGERLAVRGSTVSVPAGGFRKVLPPRPGGTLALLEATRADVVVLAHRGLEGFARVRDVWEGGLVGSTVAVRFWRIDRSAVPAERSARVDWLFRVWADVDAWVCGEQSLSAEE